MTLSRYTDEQRYESHYKATFTVASVPTPIVVTAAKALWLDTNTIAWNGVAGASYKLLYDPDGGVADCG